ncbi:MAG: hypothetical protein NVS3B2_06430 [Ramlibacter sp.]
MRLFAATLPDEVTQRTAVPLDILRRLAFGRPQRRSIQPAMPVPPAAPAPVIEALPQQHDEGFDLDHRVRQSGEW